MIIVGINKAGDSLITFAHDLLNRIDIIRFESNPDSKVQQVIEKGELYLHVYINVKDEIVAAAQGSFYIAQMLAREVCKRASILERCIDVCATTESFEAVRADVWERLSLLFRKRCIFFCRGNKMKKEGRAPYLHILRWLAEGSEWTLSLRDAIRTHPSLRGSVGQVVDKDYLRDLIGSNGDLSAVMHFDSTAEQLTVEDPQFIFYIRNIAWKSFASEVGFISLDFTSKYDFALSFAGENRNLAETIFSVLQEAEVEVFYDRNEQHRIIASDVEEYLTLKQARFEPRAA